MLDVKPNMLIAELMRMNVFASINAEIDLNNFERSNIGVLIGSGSGGTVPETEKESIKLFNENRNTISPIYVPKMLPNMAASNVSRIFNLEGYSNAVSTACAAGTQAIGEAYEVILRGDADIMLAGGAEAPFCETTLGGFCNMQISENLRKSSLKSPSIYIQNSRRVKFFVLELLIYQIC